MNEFLKPSRLRAGDTVAIVSPSWGGPSAFPHIYEAGVRQLEDTFGLKVKEYPTARMDADEVYNNPKLRAKDINDAFADPEVKAIFATIGGDDSVRLLPYLDQTLIKKNPKIVMGYSDTTTLLTCCNQLGLVTFHGPTIMAGFSQIPSFPQTFVEHIKSMFFACPETYEYNSYDTYSEGYPDWGKVENVGLIKNKHPKEDWHWVQGKTVVQGPLFGGCIEVLQYFLNGTAFWPDQDFWNGKILFLETSEEHPPISVVRYTLRGLAMQGVFDRISGLAFGRARDYSLEEKTHLDKAIVTIVTKEFGHPELPILTNLDFGHTDPQWIIPLGVKAEIDCINKRFHLIERACI